MCPINDIFSAGNTIRSKDSEHKIHRRAIQAILNKLGVNKSFPRRVAFGPKDLCGMALMDMSVEQGLRQVQHFTDHLFSRNSVGNMILIALRISAT
jgi:hypothetical protein